MSGVDWTTLEKLREQGAIKVTFHASGELASVEFTSAAPKGDVQHEPPQESPKRRMSATGGLVPRAPVPDPQ